MFIANILSNHFNLKEKSLATIHFYNPFTPRSQNMYKRVQIKEPKVMVSHQRSRSNFFP